MVVMIKVDRDIVDRKVEHIETVLKEDVSYHISTLFNDITLIHDAVPELSLHKIDTKINFLNREFNVPILIDSMTGGAKIAEKINKNLALAAYEANIPISCGSQRSGLKHRNLEYTYRVMRDVSKDLFIIGNMGLQQLIKDPINIAIRAIEMIDADALAIHLNPLQEAVQLKGDVDFEGGLKAIEKITSQISVPIIVKETGAGISGTVAKKLEAAGISAINVSGAGGTSWSAVEIIRLRNKGSNYRDNVASVFWDWGIPTAASLIEVLNSTFLPVISSGGIRNGLDIAKSLALGASLCGIAHPFLSRAMESSESVIELIDTYTDQLKIAMLLTGSENVRELLKADIVITGKLIDWVRYRGIDVEEVRRKTYEKLYG
jgi:isopentenyl-diphosphate delta-isomerase